MNIKVTIDEKEFDLSERGNNLELSYMNCRDWCLLEIFDFDEDCLGSSMNSYFKIEIDGVVIFETK